MNTKFLAALGALLVGLIAYSFAPPPKPASATFTDQTTFGGTSTGSANAQTINIPNLSANTIGVQIRFIPGFTNTGPTQVNVSGIGLVNVLRPSSIGLVALSGQELWAGEPTSIMYNGSAYVLTSNVDVTPIGKVVQFRGATAPRGTLIEDGSCVSQATYAALFSVIGSTYGTCSAGLFALPDARGSLFAALDTQGVNGAANRITSAGSGCAATAIGTRCGGQNQTLSLSQLPGGITSSAYNTITVNSTTSTVLYGWYGLNAGVNGTFNAPQNSGTITSTGSNLISVTSNNTGGGSHPILPPLVLGLSAIKY